MRWQGNQLTYCLNVHPGESLALVLAAIDGPVREVKRHICPDAPFGLGLRLSATAVRELNSPEKSGQPARPPRRSWECTHLRSTVFRTARFTASR